MKPYYDDGKGIVIYHGDCREILPTLPKVDLVLTDPPYGIGENGKRSNRNRKSDDRWRGPSNKDYGRNEWDSKPIPFDLLTACINHASRAIVFGGNYYDLPKAKCWLIWDKCTDKNNADFEMAWTNLDCACRRYRYLWDGFRQEVCEDRFHPTQKPIEVINWAMLLASDASQTILDPFMGSGTTLRSAKDLGRKCIGIEIEERYCEIAARRLAQEVFEFA